jgi:gamma-glutamylcyclotransferase (GGCT)/AIG2-like uncharacterized protein YtfP
MTEIIFSYGTLQQEKTQIELFGRLLNGTKDFLSGYKIVPIEIMDETFLAKGEQKYQLTLVPSNDSIDQIEGTALEISEKELMMADKYEPENYKRFKVQLQSGKEAWIYRSV